jgi:tRNA uridine 5-carboxymethylaminomethyl modification enzyme
MFDVIVVGAGHAGCEAVLAASRIGAKAALVTLKLDKIAQMSCNPAIGGVAKGHLVREIDALGGAMGRVIDATGIQFRRLNLSRGPAVRSTRAQADSKKYREKMTQVILSAPGVTVFEDEVVDILTDAAAVTGVRLKNGGEIKARAVVITTGTFLNGLCHVGSEQFAGGRIGDAPATHLSDALRRLGLVLGRFKTGTTPRLAYDSIRWDILEEQKGDEPRPRFSFDVVDNNLPQISCFLTYTSLETHAVIESNLHRSPLFRGEIKGRGPRYCPSVEDKIVRFTDKDRHQIFLEPEGLDTDRVYPNGLSTSLPKDVQEAFLRTIVGLENVRVLQHGYAVEYDFSQPSQLLPNLMTKTTPGLFLAGQINGTSGYEEAAAQGLMAGINAVRFVVGQESAVLGRHEAYIGVLVDDLVTKGVDEPYRLFTSRAEYRLLLREANAEERLSRRGVEWGIVPCELRARAAKRLEEREALRKFLSERKFDAEMVRRFGFPTALINLPWVQGLKRTEVSMASLALEGFSNEALVAVEEEIKYEGYIVREAREAERLSEMELIRLPSDADYSMTSGLSHEIQEKLNRVKPQTLGQASRIPGMTPAGLALLRVHAWKRNRVSSEAVSV